MTNASTHTLSISENIILWLNLRVLIIRIPFNLEISYLQHGSPTSVDDLNLVKVE
jgi:hypothetical protein